MPTLKPAPFAIPGTNLGHAIGDLPELLAGQGVNECDYDLNRQSRSELDGGGKTFNYLHEILEVEISEKLTNHVARPHSSACWLDLMRLNFAVYEDSI